MYSVFFCSHLGSIFHFPFSYAIGVNKQDFMRFCNSLSFYKFYFSFLTNPLKELHSVWYTIPFIISHHDMQKAFILLMDSNLKNWKMIVPSTSVTFFLKNRELLFPIMALLFPQGLLSHDMFVGPPSYWRNKQIFTRISNIT